MSIGSGMRSRAAGRIDQRLALGEGSCSTSSNSSLGGTGGSKLSGRRKADGDRPGPETAAARNCQLRKPAAAGLRGPALHRQHKTRRAGELALEGAQNARAFDRIVDLDRPDRCWRQRAFLQQASPDPRRPA